MRKEKVKIFDIKKKEIKIVVIIPEKHYDLLIKAACHYFSISINDLFMRSSNREQARQKGLLFYLLKKDLQIPSSEIAQIVGSTRQNIDQAVDKTEAEINIYLQSACDCRNIRAIFASLQKEQIEWLNRDLQSSNMKL